jgi:hypothetical protein
MIAMKRWIAGAALAAAVAVPMLTPAPAEAWWRGGWGWHAGWAHPGWGWHAGWGWGGGVYAGVPPVVVGAAAYPYAPYRWIPGYYAPNGARVPAHWGY